MARAHSGDISGVIQIHLPVDIEVIEDFIFFAERTPDGFLLAGNTQGEVRFVPCFTTEGLAKEFRNGCGVEGPETMEPLRLDRYEIEALLKMAKESPHILLLDPPSRAERN